MRTPAALLLIVLLSVPLAAQDDPTDELWEPDAGDARSFAAIRLAHPEEPGIGDTIDAFRTLRNGLARSSAYTTPADEALRNKLLAQLDLALAMFRRVRDGGGSASDEDAAAAMYRLREDYHLRRFRLDSATRRWFELHGEPRDGWVNIADLGGASPDAARDFRYRAATADKLLSELNQPQVKVTVEQTEIVNAKWEAFVRKGPTQFPWEAFVNDRLTNSLYETPPTMQLIVLHPMVAVEITNRSLDDFRGTDALLVEALGFARYRYGSTATPTLRWWGVSAIIGVHEDRKPGVGAMFHYNRTIAAGLLWGDSSSTADDPTVVFGIDLYQTVKKEVPAVRERIRKAKEWRQRVSGNGSP